MCCAAGLRGVYRYFLNIDRLPRVFALRTLRNFFERLRLGFVAALFIDQTA